MAVNKSFVPGIKGASSLFKSGRLVLSFRMPEPDPEEVELMKSATSFCRLPLLQGAVFSEPLATHINPEYDAPAENCRRSKAIRPHYTAKEHLWWSYAEAAVYSGLKRRTLQTYASRGSFRTRPHGVYRVDRVDFERFLTYSDKD